MVEVFITDIQSTIQTERILNTIQIENNVLKINFDFGETNLSFPCGHTILRIEGDKFNSDKIRETVRNQGFNCQLLEDKICAQSTSL